MPTCEASAVPGGSRVCSSASRASTADTATAFALRRAIAALAATGKRTVAYLEQIYARRVLPRLRHRRGRGAGVRRRRSSAASASR